MKGSLAPCPGNARRLASRLLFPQREDRKTNRHTRHPDIRMGIPRWTFALSPRTTPSDPYRLRSSEHPASFPQPRDRWREGSKAAFRIHVPSGYRATQWASWRCEQCTLLLAIASDTRTRRGPRCYCIPILPGSRVLVDISTWRTLRTITRRTDVPLSF